MDHPKDYSLFGRLDQPWGFFCRKTGRSHAGISIGKIIWGSHLAHDGMKGFLSRNFMSWFHILGVNVEIRIPQMMVWKCVAPLTVSLLWIFSCSMNISVGKWLSPTTCDYQLVLVGTPLWHFALTLLLRGSVPTHAEIASGFGLWQALNERCAMLR